MKKSRFTFSIRRDNGELVIFSAMSGAVLRISGESISEYEAFCNNRSPDTKDPLVGAALVQARDSLKQAMILLDDEVDEISLLAQLYARKRYENAHKLALCVAPTMKCNLACPYCFNPRGKRETMTRAVMQDVAGFLTSQLLTRVGRQSTVRVSWTGGEPLYDMDTMGELAGMLHRRAAEHDCTFTSTVISNGTLLTADIASTLSAEPFHTQRVQVTLDGPKSMHDKARVPRSGKGTFDTICENVGLARQFFPISLRVGVAPEFEPADFETLLDELGARGAMGAGGFPLSMFMGRVCPCKDDRPSLTTAMPVARFATVELECARIARRRGFGGFSLGMPSSPSHIPCGSLSSNACAIDNNGFICTCIEMLGQRDQALGHVGTGYGSVPGRAALPPLATQWELYNPFVRMNTECAECVLLPACEAGCPLRRIAGEELECMPAKYNLEERILFTYLGG